MSALRLIPSNMLDLFRTADAVLVDAMEFHPARAEVELVSSHCCGNARATALTHHVEHAIQKRAFPVRFDDALFKLFKLSRLHRSIDIEPDYCNHNECCVRAFSR